MINIFISYAHVDLVYKDELEKHLSVMKRNGEIAPWTDKMIIAGEMWDEAISNSLSAADIIILLISPDFLSSDYCYDNEMRSALQRHADKKAIVIPIILRFCDWMNTSFSKLQALPTYGKPVKDWADQDKAFYDIVDGIKKAIKALSEKKAAQPAKDKIDKNPAHSPHTETSAHADEKTYNIQQITSANFYTIQGGNSAEEKNSASKYPQQKSQKKTLLLISGIVLLLILVIASITYKSSSGNTTIAPVDSANKVPGVSPPSSQKDVQTSTTTENSSQQSETAEDIIKKHEDAMGGSENWRNINSVSITGKGTFAGKKSILSIYTLRDKGSRFAIKVAGIDWVHSVITPTGGETCTTDDESHITGKGKMKMSEKELKDQQESLDPDPDALINFKSKGNIVSYVGKEQAEGIECYKFNVMLTCGKLVTLFIDANSYYCIRTTEKSLVDGKAIVNKYSSFKKFPPGVIYPTVMEQLYANINSHVTYTSIEFNKYISENIFDMN